MRLQVVKPAPEVNHQTMTDRRSREQRIDLLGVDRSHLEGAPIPRWSEEALGRGELYRQAERAAITVEERIAAWRGIQALPAVKR